MAKMQLDFIPQSFLEFAHELEKRGIEAYFVGGALRDQLLGREVHDFDLASSARPDELITLFPDAHIVETGIEHGTVTFVLADGNLEVTSFREDVEDRHGDHRHPAEVRFGRNLEEDLARRDFTINALALSPSGELIDLYGGLEDLRRRCLRAVGDPRRRFDEDALRILRALRFASCLEFHIDAEAEAAIFAQRSLLKHLSVERIDHEMGRLLRGKGAASILLHFKEVFAEIWPSFTANLEAAKRGELSAVFRGIENIAACFEALGCEGNLREDFFFLFLTADVAPELWPEAVFRAAMAMHGPRERADRLRELARVLGDEPPLTLYDWKVFYHCYFKRLRSEHYFEMLRILARFSKRLSFDLSAFERAYQDFKDAELRGDPLRISDLEISGADILAAELATGRGISLALERALELCFQEPTSNRRELLLAYLQDQLKDE